MPPVIVLGLGTIGRQVALLLAMSGIPRLRLVDGRVVSQATHTVEGYAAEDVGRLRAHAVAHDCHQISPERDIRASQRCSLDTIGAENAVFCCEPSLRRQRLAWNTLSRRVRFHAGVHVGGDQVHLAIVAHASALESIPDPDGTPPHWQPDTHSRTTVHPVHTAGIVAGLMVTAFTRALHGDPGNQLIHLDLRNPTLTTREIC